MNLCSQALIGLTPGSGVSPGDISGVTDGNSLPECWSLSSKRWTSWRRRGGRGDSSGDSKLRSLSPISLRIVSLCFRSRSSITHNYDTESAVSKGSTFVMRLVVTRRNDEDLHRMMRALYRHEKLLMLTPRKKQSNVITVVGRADFSWAAT